MSKRLLSVQKIVNLSGDPATGNSGEIYYNTSIQQFKYYDGTSWLTFESGGVSIGETPPASPTEGDLWFDSNTTDLFIYYDSVWVQLNGGGGGGGVTSVNGTTDEIDVSASTGSITLSLPSTINADLSGTAASATYASTAGSANAVAAN